MADTTIASAQPLVGDSGQRAPIAVGKVLPNARPDCFVRRRHGQGRRICHQGVLNVALVPLGYDAGLRASEHTTAAVDQPAVAQTANWLAHVQANVYMGLVTGGACGYHCS
jgi:hypothetical protein